MVQKRPFDNEDLFEASSKHPRQMEHPDHLVSILEFVPSEVAPHQFHTVENRDGNEKFGSDFIPEIPSCMEKDLTATFSPSISSRDTYDTNEEDVWLEAPFDILLSPDHFNSEHSVRRLSQFEDIYSLLLEHPPHKSVAIGPDHQAVIPEWRPQDTYNMSEQMDTSGTNIMPQALESDLIVGDNRESELMGTCVIPMPDLEELPAIDTQKVGNSRNDCSCQDRGSVGCVRQHIAEAREKLKRTLGQEIFLELGFCDMGEVVAVRWNKEEEQLFREVIFSNPASLGKNFWDHLAAIFPSRTKKDIVSYYFNIFLLQKRAEQNRCDPMSIDSDNDEWQGDDFDDDGTGMMDENEDTVVDSHAQNEDAAYENCADLNRDDTYTSSDTGSGSLESQKDEHWPGCFDGLSNTHEYGLEPCDAKVWDVRYMTCTRNELDFLPTCSRIDKVFGHGVWNYQPKDGKGLSECS